MSAIEFSFRRFFWGVAAFVLLQVAGMIGFRIILDESWLTALYRTLVTTTLTGEVSQPVGASAEIYTMVVLVGGVAIFLYLAGALAELIARGILGDTFAERRRRHAIDRLSQHVIICGFGRVGKRVAEELRASGIDHVVVDINEDALARARELESLVILGDGTDDTDLERAGLSRARALVATADSDQANLFITLSARALHRDLLIVARASDDSAARKLRLAGADKIVQPYSTAGLHMANLVLKPQVADFLDIVTTAGGPAPDLRFDEILVTKACGHCGVTLGDLRVQDQTGAVVIALRKQDGTFDVTPNTSAMVEEGDVLIGVGTTQEIALLEQMFAPKAAFGG